MFKVVYDKLLTVTVDWKGSANGIAVTPKLNLPEPYHDIEIFLHRNTDNPQLMVISNKPLIADVNSVLNMVDDLGSITELTINKTNVACAIYPGSFYTGIHGDHQAMRDEDFHYRVQLSCPQSSSSVVSFASKMSLAFESELCADFKLLIGDQAIKVNKLIVMASSDVFKTMIESELLENKDNEVVITDIEYEPMLLLVKAMYTGQLDLNQDVQLAIKVLTAADKYNVQEIVKACGEFIVNNLSEANILSVLTQVIKLEVTEVMAGCLEYLGNLDKRKLTAIKQSDEWNKVKPNFLVSSLIGYFSDH